MEKEFEEQIAELKGARDRLLRFHKLLIDRERKEIERQTGAITPGQFLGMLMNDGRFDWLRTISRLVVRIDEAFDLDDGMPPELLAKYRTEIVAMLDDSDEHLEFKALVSSRLKVLPEADSIRTEIRSLLE